MILTRASWTVNKVQITTLQKKHKRFHVNFNNEASILASIQPGNCFKTRENVWWMICLLLPFSRHFAFILASIFPDLVISNNITLSVFSLRVSSWRSRFDSFFLRSTFVVIKARSSWPPCRIGKSAGRSSSTSRHELSVFAFSIVKLQC